MASSTGFAEYTSPVFFGSVYVSPWQATSDAILIKELVPIKDVIMIPAIFLEAERKYRDFYVPSGKPVSRP